jgi:hypothetical protein
MKWVMRSLYLPSLKVARAAQVARPFLADIAHEQDVGLGLVSARFIARMKASSTGSEQVSSPMPGA